MKIVLQRVASASVTVDNMVIGSIQQGLLVLLGIGKDDTHEHSDALMHKMLNLRIFADEQGKMNKSIQDVGGGILLVSQFTLYANTKKGNRPSFIEAMPPQEAEVFYNEFIERLQKQYARVATGKFGADMKVQLCNDGPVTIILEV